MWKLPIYEADQAIEWKKLEDKFDWLNDMKNVPQESEWHAEGNVYIHTFMVINSLIAMPEFKELSEQAKHIVFTAALFHDIEKRSSTIIENENGIERISSPGHTKKGEYTTRKILYVEIPTPFAIREEIAKLVRHHGLPLWAIEKRDPKKEVIEASLCLNTKYLYILAKADALGRICKDKDEFLLRLELFKEICIENDCFGKAWEFKSDYGRYLYLNRSDLAPDYEPYDDLKFNVYLLSGLPGTGKDTYIKKNYDLPILSLDDIRREHKISPTDRKLNGQVIQFAKEKAKEYMRMKRSFIFNGTNITREMRGSWISLFTEYGARVRIIYLEVPYNILLQQNHNRDYKVPTDVIDKLIGKLEIPTYRESHEIEFVIKD